MLSVATIMSPGTGPALPASLLSDLAGILKSDCKPVPLHETEAADIPFSCNRGQDLQAVRQALLRHVDGLPIDIVVQPQAHRRKKLLIADMDSTMIGQECIDELAAEVGVKEQVSAITERAMAGAIDFEPALRERVALLAGLPETIVQTVIDARIRLNPGSRTLVQTMRRNGAYCALVSGGFTAFTATIADRIGFHENRANVLVAKDGYFTGAVEDPILGRDAKRERLAALCSQQEIELQDTIAVGDGANDLDMVTAAGLGIAYHAKPALIKEADASIGHCDLTALLYAQGYLHTDFVEAEKNGRSTRLS